jgi:4-hydroxy-tetrahydrodipicolinate synthase
MISHSLSGVFVASLTPPRANFTLHIDSVPVLLDFFAQRGCHSTLLLGTTGEGPSLSQQEHMDIFRAAIIGTSHRRGRTSSRGIHRRRKQEIATMQR